MVHKPPGEYTQWGWRTSKGPFGETGCAIRRELEFECWEDCEEGERETGGSCRGWREAGRGAPSSVRRGPLVISVSGEEARGVKRPRHPSELEDPDRAP